MANIYWSAGTTDVSTAVNFSGSSLPGTGDNLALIPEYNTNMSGNVTALTSISLGTVSVLSGNTSALGAFATYLELDTTGLDFAGGGQSFIDLQASSIDVMVTETYQTSTKGVRGLYLKGSAIGTLKVSGGDVGVAFVHGETSTVTTARVTGGILHLGDGVTLTTLEVHSGVVHCNCNVTNLKVYGGTVHLNEDSDVTNLTQEGGSIESHGTGDITTATLNGGKLNMDGSSSRTITTLKVNPNGGISYDPLCVTITNHSAPDAPIVISTAGK